MMFQGHLLLCKKAGNLDQVWRPIQLLLRDGEPPYNMTLLSKGCLFQIFVMCRGGESADNFSTLVPALSSVKGEIIIARIESWFAAVDKTNTYGNVT